MANSIVNSFLSFIERIGQKAGRKFDDDKSSKKEKKKFSAFLNWELCNSSWAQNLSFDLAMLNDFAC
jgi:hypothetical protein